jgi:hypothetical protein
MEAIFEIATIGRVVERIIVACGGLVAMLLGWHLFKTGVVIDQTVSGEYKDVKVAFSKVGPGVFFAIFGTSVLLFCLYVPLKLEPLQPAGSGGSAANFQYLGGGREIEYIKVANAIIAISRNSDDNRIKQSAHVLSALRQGILIGRFSQSDLQYYNENAQRYHVNPTEFNVTDRARLRAIDEIAAAQFDD